MVRMDRVTAEGHITAVVAAWLVGLFIMSQGMEKGQFGLGCLFTHLSVLGLSFSFPVHLCSSLLQENPHYSG